MNEKNKSLNLLALTDRQLFLMKKCMAHLLYRTAVEESPVEIRTPAPMIIQGDKLLLTDNVETVPVADLVDLFCLCADLSNRTLRQNAYPRQLGERIKPDEPAMAIPTLIEATDPGETVSPTCLRINIPTYRGDDPAAPEPENASERNPEYDYEQMHPVRIQFEDGLRIIFGSADVMLERGTGQWRVFVHPGEGDPVFVIKFPDHVAIEDLQVVLDEEAGWSSTETAPKQKTYRPNL